MIDKQRLQAKITLGLQLTAQERAYAILYMGYYPQDLKGGE